MAERRSAQVCDRCRTKRIKCDGRRPKCGKCERAGLDCSVSVRLRRRTTPRGYVEPTSEVIGQLTEELDTARSQLQLVSARESELNATINSQNKEIERLRELVSNSSSNSYPRAADERAPAPSGPVVGHLGRLVLGDGNAEFFAGSTTGVHFVLSAQQQYQTTFASREHFPECLFRLHVLQPTDVSEPHLPSTDEIPANLHEFEYIHLRGLGEGTFRRLFDRHQQIWELLYPVLLSRQFFEMFHHTISQYPSSSSLDRQLSVPFLLQAYALVALDSVHTGGGASVPQEHLSPLKPSTYNTILSDLFGRMPCRGGLSSLQGLVLYLLYLQTTSQHSLAIRVCGMAARLAQSLGLHRHSRRFKHPPGEAELRKRLWWSIYVLDVQSSILYGLPRTIQSADTDTDLPINADYDDISCDQLSYPLPGESTRIEPFLHYIHLAQILSRMLEQMYTTTHRRGGVAKIHRLQRELDLWKQNLQPGLPGVAIVEQSIYSRLQTLQSQNHNNTSSNNSNSTSNILPQPNNPNSQSQPQPQNTDPISLWLFLLGELATLLIHRPALTFGSQDPHFAPSLRFCVDASSHLILAFEAAASSSSPTHKTPLFSTTWPAGPHLLSQSALMLLYDAWLQSPSQHHSSPHTSAAPIATETISLAVTLLSKDTPSSSSPSHPTSDTEPLHQTASYLRRLYAQTFAANTASIASAAEIPVIVDHGQQPQQQMELSIPELGVGGGGGLGEELQGELRGYTPLWAPLSIDEINEMGGFEFTDSLLIPWDG